MLTREVQTGWMCDVVKTKELHEDKCLAETVVWKPHKGKQAQGCHSDAPAELTP